MAKEKNNVYEPLLVLDLPFAIVELHDVDWRLLHVHGQSLIVDGDQAGVGEVLGDLFAHLLADVIRTVTISFTLADNFTGLPSIVSVSVKRN